jgi:hypothetical protein
MRRWLKRALAAVCVWLAAIGFALFTERHPHPFALGAAVVATLTVGWLCVDAFQGAETPQWSLYRAPAPARTFDPRFSRLSQELDEATDRQAASLAVHGSLSAVADRILLDKYGVDLEHDPDTAREILGDQVWSYFEATPDGDKIVFSPQLFAVLDRLESL